MDKLGEISKLTAVKLTSQFKRISADFMEPKGSLSGSPSIFNNLPSEELAFKFLTEGGKTLSFCIK